MAGVGQALRNEATRSGTKRKAAQVTPSQKCIDLVKESEGCDLTAYADPAGVWTIGYGHTASVCMGLSCIQEQAEAWLQQDLKAAGQSVETLVKVPLNQNQFDALTDFVYNLGAGSLKQSTLLKKLNAGDYAGASAEFSRWVYAKMVKLPGLVTRRLKEQALFNTPL